MQTIGSYLTTIKTSAKIVPLNTSGRSRDQIIWEAENSWLAPYLVKADIKPLQVKKVVVVETVTEIVETAHADDCRCSEPCFQKALDVLLAKSEMAASGVSA